MNIQHSIKLARHRVAQALETIDAGETLSGLAQRHYGDQSLWPLIAVHNNLTTPHSIHYLKQGNELKIPPKRALNSREKRLYQDYMNEFYPKKNKPQSRPQNTKKDTSNIQSLKYHQKLRTNPLLKEEAAKQLGLTDISKVSGFILKYPECNFLHPKLASILFELSKTSLTKYIRITEAFPATVNHMSRTHFNGQAADFTISDPQQADEISKFLKDKGLKVLNEYENRFSHSTAGHIHTSL